MLSLSQTAGYAIQALSCLEASGAEWVRGEHIAEESGVPRPYLTQILHALGKSGIIHTKRGPAGGYLLARPSKEVSVLEVAKAVDGEGCLGSCLLGRAVCSDLRACPTHEFWKVERIRIEKCLAGLSLADVAAFERKQARGSKKKPGRAGWLKAKTQSG